LRLFVADELIEGGVTPETLMKAQGFDPRRVHLRQLRMLHVMPYDRKELLENIKYKLKLADI
jgi:hypothetical protein